MNLESSSLATLFLSLPPTTPLYMSSFRNCLCNLYVPQANAIFEEDVRGSGAEVGKETAGIVQLSSNRVELQRVVAVPCWRGVILGFATGF